MFDNSITVAGIFQGDQSNGLLVKTSFKKLLVGLLQCIINQF